MSTNKRKATQSTDANKKAKTGNASITSFFGPPKTVAAPKASGTPATNGTTPAPEPPAAKFNKEKWVASLTEEQRELLQLEINTLDDSWLAHLREEVTSKEFLELKRFLSRELAGTKKIFPPQEEVYSWSRHTPFHKVKVVILGQDPYHNVNQAHGLAFSVRPPTAAPPSLRNIYIGLKKDYPTFTAPPAKGGLLTPWADRGVLLLNTCLTVRAHEANSHANRGWEKFTQRVIDLVALKRTRGVAFMAWGTPAGKRVIKIDKKRHLVLNAVHPSPLSASRGFFDCGHFKKANEWLVTRYGEGSEIDWDLGTPEKTKAPGEILPPPRPVVAVGKAAGEGGVEEKSELVEKEGESGTINDTNGTNGTNGDKSKVLEKEGDEAAVNGEKK